MSQVIRIPKSLYKRLENMAVGFDTPANVIERLVSQQDGGIMDEDQIQKRINKITQEVIEKAYLLAKDVYEQKLSITDAQTELVDGLEMHSGSARDYINNFQKMMDGECYQRTMNGLATDYYLKNIFSEFGVKKLKEALCSVEQHVEYYETFSNGKLQNIRKIHQKYSDLL